jgi:dihydrofolate synthase/folylpolyglutamate synthase
MLGRHQAANAAVAVAAIGRLRDRGWQVSDADIRQGLAEAVLPARTEIVSGPAPVVLDAAHNVASVQALVEMLRESFPPGPGRRHVLVFAASQDKDVAGMLRLLLTQFDLVILTRFLQNPRAADPHAMLQLARQILTNGVPAKTQVVTQPDPVSAWELARGAAGSQDLVCVAGSFFLASELRSLIQAQPHSLRGRLAPLACQTEQ